MSCQLVVHGYTSTSVNVQRLTTLLLLLLCVYKYSAPTMYMIILCNTIILISSSSLHDLIFALSLTNSTLVGPNGIMTLI